MGRIRIFRMGADGVGGGRVQGSPMGTHAYDVDYRTITLAQGNELPALPLIRLSGCRRGKGHVAGWLA